MPLLGQSRLQGSLESSCPGFDYDHPWSRSKSVQDRDISAMKQLARWVSILAHPFVMVALLVAVPAMRQSSGNVVQSVLLVMIAVVVPIAVLMFRQVRRGRWSDADTSKGFAITVLP